MSIWTQRRDLQRLYSYAIPNDAALDAIAAWSPVVEIGAGTGYWASLLAASGADVRAYDIAPGPDNSWVSSERYYGILPGGPSVLSRSAHWTLFLCWPPYDDPMAVKALRAHRGHRVVYVGEGDGGCCADDAFFVELDRHWTLVREVAIPQWWGVYDRAQFYTRRR